MTRTDTDDWRTQAACHGATHIFYDAARFAEAIEICEQCPVRVACMLNVDTSDGTSPARYAVVAGIRPETRGFDPHSGKPLTRIQNARLHRRPRRGTAAIPTEILDRIMTEHSAGWSYQSIAERLTADGVPTAQGGSRWWSSSVRSLHLAIQHSREATA